MKRAAYGRMVEHVAAGQLTARVERVPLDAAEEAWARQGSSHGFKLVLMPDLDTEDTRRDADRCTSGVS